MRLLNKITGGALCLQSTHHKSKMTFSLRCCVSVYVCVWLWCVCMCVCWLAKNATDRSSMWTHKQARAHHTLIRERERESVVQKNIILPPRHQTINIIYNLFLFYPAIFHNCTLTISATFGNAHFSKNKNKIKTEKCDQCCRPPIYSFFFLKICFLLFGIYKEKYFLFR